jgi:hypothetical protein
MINKQQLQEILTELKSIKDAEDNLNKALKVFSPDFNFLCFSRQEELLLNTLKIAMDDKDDWIGYFLYERDGKFTNKKIISDKNGKNLPLRNYDDLWNLITKK